MNITNPKVSIFFIAFLPQFTDPAKGEVSTQIILLGALFMLATIIVFSAVACFAASLGEYLKKSAHIQRNLHKVTGLIFVGLALRLAITSR